MLLLVLGAGASYDSIPSLASRKVSHRDRPPLADELFDPRPDFTQAMRNFPQCQPIIPYLRHRPEGVPVERVLQSLQDEAQDYRKRLSQLAAVRYYLHMMVWECEMRWNDAAAGITNYKTLLDQIERWKQVNREHFLVTFNYDTMIETALMSVGVQISALPDYIRHDSYKLFKLHGSVNWAHLVNSDLGNINDVNVWEVARQLIDRAPELDLGNIEHLARERPIAKVGNVALFPAIAIPVESKSAFECPSEHLEVLKGSIKEMTKLLVIGWRGAEADFLELLARQQQHELMVHSVAGSREGASQTIANLQKAGVRGKFTASEGGFTEFVVNREADDFLRA